MFNVLPNILKEEVTQEYRIRRWIVIICHIIFIQIAFLIIIIPAILFLVYQEKEVVADLQYIRESVGTKNTNTIGQILSDTNTILSVVSNRFQYSDAISIVDHLLEHKNYAIHLTNIMYSSTGTSTAQIAIEGVADTRNDLVTFEKNIEKAAYFDTVDLPVSNLAKEKKVEFTLNLTKK